MAAGTAKRTPAPRRSRLDIRFGRHLGIGQEWLRDGWRRVISIDDQELAA